VNDLLDIVTPGVRTLAPYQPGKPIAELQREYGLTHIIKLASNECPYAPGAAVTDVIKTHLAQLCRYPDGNGFELKQALAKKFHVDPTQITLGNGSSDILDMVVRAFATSNNEVVFSQYGFAVYPIVTKAVSAKAVVVNAVDWGHDLRAMSAAINKNTRVVFIANPNNPTGTWLDTSELLDFIARVPHHTIVVVDEAYFEFADDPNMHVSGYASVVSQLSDYKNLVITRTFSKAYGIAGLRVGYSFSHPEVADILNRVRHPFNVNSLALLAAQAALGDKAHLHKVIENNAQGLMQLTTAFEELGLGYIQSAGNFVCVHIGENASDIYQALLKHGVIVRPVENYAMPEYLRISVGLKQENEFFLESLREAMA